MVFSISLFAQYSVNTWIGGNGKWNVDSNWEHDIPEDWNIVLIESANDKVLIPDGYNAVCRKLYVKHQNSEIDIDGNLTINSSDYHDGIVNYGEIKIGDNSNVDISNTGGSGTEGQGILNFGTMYINGTMTIWDIEESGIWNRAGGYIENQGYLLFTDNLGVRAIDNLGGEFHNYGTVSSLATYPNSFISTGGSGSFTNYACGILKSGSGYFDSNSFDNYGVILENSTHDSNIKNNYEGGVIINKSGGSFSIANDNGYYSTKPKYAVWTGCYSNVYNYSKNWASFLDLPVTDSEIIIPGDLMGSNGYPISDNYIINIGVGGKMNIEQNASLSIQNNTGSGLLNHGTTIVNGALSIDDVTVYGIRNFLSATFYSGPNSEITISNTGNNGIRNQYKMDLNNSLNINTGISNSGIKNDSPSGILTFHEGTFNINNNSNIGIANYNYLSLNSQTVLNLNDNNTGIFNDAGAQIINEGEINIVTGNTGIQSKGTLKNYNKLTITGGNTAYEGLASSVFNNLNCGYINLQGSFDLQSGNFTNNSYLLNDNQNNVFSISGIFVNNGLIKDQYDAIDVNDINNNDGIVINSQETWPGGDIQPFFTGSQPWSYSIPSGKLLSSSNSLIGEFYEDSNTFKDVSGYSDGYYPYFADFEKADGSCTENVKIYITLDNSLNPDWDSDGILNDDDNCPNISNPDQKDNDGDGQGDVCDSDDDNDGVADTNDNCPFIANPDQKDNDGDGQGDVCDSDDDNDGVADTNDNCPFVANPDQKDNDGDGQGDVCDSDDDNDGVADTNDNCPFVANPDQKDNDGDGQGDVCDSDDDNDGVEDINDNCPFDVNPEQVDTDGDGIGDVCDIDDDNDGIKDVEDNCPLIANADQSDNDEDDFGDVCDEDDDNDGVLDEDDNCQYTPNEDQEDSDGDGIGNACEDDTDGDGVLDEDDNCINTPNPDQEDSDGDGIGDACEDDTDGDGVEDSIDNCPDLPNADQLDTDEDGIGDVCDDDDDGDGYDDEEDNCPNVYNPDQLDTDEDGIGDECDSDDDNDGYDDEEDNCPETYNPEQLDTDDDGVGNECDSDDDGDGVDDDEDNCPLISNPGQEDSDGDGVGDACENDGDGDGVDNESDNCPDTYNPNQLDTDEDGIGDACDDDDDGDGYDDEEDNCPNVYNPSQSDTDDDGIGDKCDSDDDNDGYDDDEDNCPNIYNPDQLDTDGDGVGNACDSDDDGDGVEDDKDNCPLTSNPGQEDSNGDGIGDACENDGDGDGVDNESDNCPDTYNPNQLDTDEDGIGDACDDDDDGDGVDDDKDNCPLISNPGQEDSDGDGVGDACEELATFDLNMNGIKLFPNPTDNIVYVRFDNIINDNVSIVIYNQFGEMIDIKYSKIDINTIKISLADKSFGVHFMKIIVNKKLFTTKKLIIVNQ